MFDFAAESDTFPSGAFAKIETRAVVDTSLKFAATRARRMGAIGVHKRRK
jgi:hypothetical protein